MGLTARILLRMNLNLCRPLIFCAAENHFFTCNVYEFLFKSSLIILRIQRSLICSFRKLSDAPLWISYFLSDRFDNIFVRIFFVRLLRDLSFVSSV